MCFIAEINYILQCVANFVLKKGKKFENEVLAALNMADLLKYVHVQYIWRVAF